MALPDSAALVSNLNLSITCPSTEGLNYVMNQQTQPATTLTASQQRAADGFFEFLFSDKKELIISGPGGYGKTFLMGHLIDQIMPKYYKSCEIMDIAPEYDTVHMTATTNKAAEVLGEATGRPAATIHSFLGLKVKEDFSTGKSQLMKTKNWSVHTREIIFIDECSMIDASLRQVIKEGTLKSKVIYVGDHSQLPPVFEDLSSIYKENMPFFVLTEPMRSDVPEIQALCAQLRETVETGIFKPIQAHPGIIDWMDSDEVMALVEDTFVKKESNSRVLAYSNNQVNALNKFIRELRGLPEQFQVGDKLISNSALQLTEGNISVEEPLTIVRVDDHTTTKRFGSTELVIRHMDLETPFGLFKDVPVPVDKFHFDQLVKHFAKQKDWYTYFQLKNNHPDLRPRDACTVHKSQGSSYETVFVDLDNLSTCTQPKLAARLLYVAFTRARKRIVMYGNLAERYGGILE